MKKSVLIIIIILTIFLSIGIGLIFGLKHKTSSPPLTETTAPPSFTTAPPSFTTAPPSSTTNPPLEEEITTPPSLPTSPPDFTPTSSPITNLFGWEKCDQWPIGLERNESTISSEQSCRQYCESKLECKIYHYDNGCWTGSTDNYSNDEPLNCYKKIPIFEDDLLDINDNCWEKCGRAGKCGYCGEDGWCCSPTNESLEPLNGCPPPNLEFYDDNFSYHGCFKITDENMPQEGEWETGEYGVCTEEENEKCYQYRDVTCNADYCNSPKPNEKQRCYDSELGCEEDDLTPKFTFEDVLTSNEKCDYTSDNDKYACMQQIMSFPYINSDTDDVYLFNDDDDLPNFAGIKFIKNSYTWHLSNSESCPKIAQYHCSNSNLKDKGTGPNDGVTRPCPLEFMCPLGGGKDNFWKKMTGKGPPTLTKNNNDEWPYIPNNNLYGSIWPSPTSRRRIIERALGPLLLGAPYSWYWDDKYSEEEYIEKWKTDYGYDIPYAGETINPLECCASPELEIQFGNPNYVCPRQRQSAQCCGYIGQSWDLAGTDDKDNVNSDPYYFNSKCKKYRGYCGIMGAQSYLIDPEDAKAGDVVVYVGCKSEIGGKKRYWGPNTEQTNKAEGHVMLIRKILEVDEGREVLYEAWQLGGGGQPGKVTVTKVNVKWNQIGNASNKGDNGTFVIRRRNIMNDDLTWEDDSYLENQHSIGTKISRARSDYMNDFNVSERRETDEMGCPNSCFK